MKKSVKVLSLLAILSGIVGISGCDNKNPSVKPSEEPSSEIVSPSEESSVVQHTHSMTAHAAVDAFMAANGHKAYYECPDCGKFYEDEDGQKEITNLESWLNGEGKVEEVANEKFDYANANPTYVDRSIATGKIWDGWPTHISMDEEVKSPKDSTRSLKVEVESLKDENGEWKDEGHAANKAVWITYEVDLEEGFDATKYKYLEFDVKLENAQRWISARFEDAEGNLAGESLGDLYNSGLIQVSEISMDGWMHIVWNFAGAYQFDTLLDEAAELSGDEAALYSIITNAKKVRFCCSDSGSDLTKPCVVHMDNIKFSTDDDVKDGYDELEKAVEDEKALLRAQHVYATKYTGHSYIPSNKIYLSDLDAADGFKFVFKMTEGTFRFANLDMNHGWAEPTGYYVITRTGDNYEVKAEGASISKADYSIYPDVIDGWMVCELYNSSRHGKALAENVDAIDSFYGGGSTAEEIYIDFDTFTTTTFAHEDSLDIASNDAAWSNRRNPEGNNWWDGWDSTVTEETEVVSPYKSNSAIKFETKELKDANGDYYHTELGQYGGVWSSFDINLEEGTNILDYKYLEFDYKLENAQNWISARFMDADGNMSGEEVGDLLTSGAKLVITNISADGWAHVRWCIADSYNFNTLLDEDAELSGDEAKLYSILTNATKIRFCSSSSSADVDHSKPTIAYFDNIRLTTDEDTPVEAYKALADKVAAELVASHGLAVTYNGEKKIMLNESIAFADIGEGKGIKFAFKMNPDTSISDANAFRFTFMDFDNGWTHIGYFKIIRDGSDFSIQGVDAANYKIYADKVDGWMICELYYEAFNLNNGEVKEFTGMYNNFANQYTLVDPYSVCICERSN